MARYAAGTNVNEAKSHFELQQIMKKFGCLESGYMEQEGLVSFMFSKDKVTYRFSVEIPTTEDGLPRDTRYRADRHPSRLDYERSRKMRAFLAVIKAQLIAIEEGIADFGKMFIGQAVTDNGQTVAERWAPEAQRLALEGKYPSSLMGRQQ